MEPSLSTRINAKFTDNWTNTRMSDNRRCFMMGNALVCGIIKKLGETIQAIVENEE